MVERTRNYTAQRNYKYDSHDKDNNFNGLTEEAWKKQILAEWSCDKLKANHVTIIFHDKDKDENGIQKELIESLDNKTISITDLDKYQISYITKKKG